MKQIKFEFNWIIYAVLAALFMLLPLNDSTMQGSFWYNFPLCIIVGFLVIMLPIYARNLFIKPKTSWLDKSIAGAIGATLITIIYQFI